MEVALIEQCDEPCIDTPLPDSQALSVLQKKLDNERKINKTKQREIKRLKTELETYKNKNNKKTRFDYDTDDEDIDIDYEKLSKEQELEIKTLYKDVIKLQSKLVSALILN